MENVKIDDIEKLIRLADDVLKQIEVVTHEYDAEGICLWNKVDKTRADYYEQVRDLKREDSHHKRVHETKLLLSELLQEEKNFSEIYDEPAEILIQKLEPIKSLILGVFRNGAEQNTVTNETNFYADDTISDDYLMKLFAMRIRDRRILIKVQRFPKTYFLLVRGYENCHDGDEFLGVYESPKNLRIAYKKEKERMESNRDEYGALQLMIYEFNEEEYGKSDLQGKPVTPEELWGEKQE